MRTKVRARKRQVFRVGRVALTTERQFGVALAELALASVVFDMPLLVQ